MSAVYCLAGGFMVIGQSDTQQATNRFHGFLLVVLAGTIWSFGVVVVRSMEDAANHQFAYLFFRGVAIILVLMGYLIYKEGVSFYKNFAKLGLSGVVGAVFLAASMVFFIISLTTTSAAVALFMLAVSPFITAILGYIVLKESLNKQTFISMVIAFIGVMFMVYNDFLIGSISGAMFGFMAATSFSAFTVSLRHRVETPKFTTIALAGFLCMVFSGFMLGSASAAFAMSDTNIYLALLHGSIVGTGLILYSIGARYLPASELALLSLLEVVAGVLWAFLPIFGINESPTITTLSGGLLICVAVSLRGIQARRRDKYPLP